MSREDVVAGSRTDVKQTSRQEETRLRAWLKFGVGLVVLVALVAFFAGGYSPPGACGDVLRHNQANEIDASPLFYTEVANMSQLEEGIVELRKQASRRRAEGSLAREPRRQQQ